MSNITRIHRNRPGTVRLEWTLSSRKGQIEEFPGRLIAVTERDFVVQDGNFRCRPSRHWFRLPAAETELNGAA